MKSPLVYLREGQSELLNEHFQQHRQDALKAVSFEWKSESVFHVFVKSPEVSPRGYPLPAYIFQSANVFELGKAEDLLKGRDLKAICQQSEATRFLVLYWVCASQSKSSEWRIFLVEKGRVRECKKGMVPRKSELFSRSKGILETDILAGKRVAIVGMGSFGAPIALELAKAGVGHFDLIDFDRMELSNVARHICGLNDLGRYKTHAVRDQLHLKNPYVSVDTYELNVNERSKSLEKVFGDSDLIIAVTDENRSRFKLNEYALRWRKPALFARAITRAAGGDIFRLRPGEGPCLACLFDKGLFDKNEEVSGERQARRDAPAYMNPTEVKAQIQVGLSSDILPLTTMTVKLALMELCRGINSGLQSLEEDLEADFYIWANRRELIYENWPPMKYFFQKNSILRWYGVKVAKNEECLTCQVYDD